MHFPIGAFERGAAAAMLATLLALCSSAEGREATKAPEFPHLDPSLWLGTPVRMEALRGRVVLLDVWTFG